jgi:threonine/homoserine/homoserine lactone efflux protein
MTSPIDTGVLWSFLLLWLVIVPTPGANSLMVTHTALTRPAAHVAFAILGNVTGVILLGTAALLGWAALLDVFPWLRTAVHLLGGAYLIYFGWRLVSRARSSPAQTATVDDRRHINQSEPIKAIGLGLVTALSNAQAILFITSIFAASGVLTATPATGLAVLAIMATCNVTYLGCLGWMFQRDAVRVRYQRFQRRFETAIGAVFMVFGGRLVWRELMRSL